ncbi:deoxyguanosinetriphosphate triphosphohydrolase family protein [Tannockella kyphosi]|uniref:deoxyguanosinetriphosphate triphosphohydrolase family protein n=1 Tax=Tannockella kyphosi TaxID=2899121 RepID=UPI002010FF24|nr:HD domain-containing protein [Tannockella kyphosi]
MIKNKFEKEAMNELHPNYEIAITRSFPLYQRENDIRGEFGRDYTRILFSQGYRRLKHKTQVFFAPENDHVCTRSEHVNLVESISYTISKFLGLNEELTKCIAIGHDLGHAPFGHGGESIIKEIGSKHQQNIFFHERNSLHFIDSIETLEDDNHIRQNLNLTYAVRDGIISHCGEVNQRNIMRRNEVICLDDYTKPGQYAPYTWEGCVVKMSDKIAYLARDIEDALRLNIINQESVDIVKNEINLICEKPFDAINNGTVVNYFILDVCKNSSLETGITLSKEAHTVMKLLMKYNYQNIYLIDRVKVHKQYVSLILNSIFDLLYKCHQDDDFMKSLKSLETNYPKLMSSYLHWVIKYGNVEKPICYQNKILYNFSNTQSTVQCILDFISGMSDVYIISIFQELLEF